MSGKLEVIPVEPGLDLDQIFDILENQPVDHPMNQTEFKTPERKAQKRKREEEECQQPQPPPPLQMEAASPEMKTCVPCKIGAASIFNFDQIKQLSRQHAFEMSPTSLWSFVVRQFIFTYHSTSCFKDDFAMDFRVGNLIMDYLVDPGQQFLAPSGSSETQQQTAVLRPQPVALSLDLTPQKFYKQTSDKKDYLKDEKTGEKILNFTTKQPDRHAGSKLTSTFHRLNIPIMTDSSLTLWNMETVSQKVDLIIPEVDDGGFPVRGGLILGILVLTDRLNLLNLFCFQKEVLTNRFDCAKKVLPLVLMRRLKEWSNIKLDNLTAVRHFGGTGMVHRQVAVHDKHFDTSALADEHPPKLDLSDAVSAEDIEQTNDWIYFIIKGFEAHPNHIFTFMAFVFRQSCRKQDQEEQVPDNYYQTIIDCSSFIMPELPGGWVPQRSNPFATLLATLMSETTNISQVRSILIRSLQHVAQHLNKFRSDLILS